MNVITDTWRQLVRRRLWPVALVLVAALAAVPVLLAKDPAPVPAAVPDPMTGSVAKKVAADTEPIVALASAGDAGRRRVLGARKDPFEPAPAPKVKAAQNPSPSTGPSTGTPIDDPSPTGGTGPGTSGGTPIQPSPSPGTTPVTPAPPKRNLPRYALTLRFGDANTDSLQRMTVSRLEALPSAEDPVLVYLGVSGKDAVFLVDANVLVQGDGVCEPDPATCDTVRLRAGETEFFDVKDEDDKVVASYQLDLVKIHGRKAGKSAKKSKLSISKASRKLLLSRTGLSARDSRFGALQRLGANAWLAAVAAKSGE